MWSLGCMSCQEVYETGIVLIITTLFLQWSVTHSTWHRSRATSQFCARTRQNVSYYWECAQQHSWEWLNAAQSNIFAHDTVIQHLMFLSKEQGCSHPLIAVSLVYKQCFLLGSRALSILRALILPVKPWQANLQRCYTLEITVEQHHSLKQNKTTYMVSAAFHFETGKWSWHRAFPGD